MNLAGIFKRNNQNIRANDTVKSSEGMSRGERSYRVQNEIRSLLPGQTIQGAVVGRNGNVAQIALSQELLINARIDQSISLALGQNMSFEVKSNNGSVLSLTPLYANMANEATIQKALAAAGLSDSLDNMKMVAAMMKEGMPIDRDSIAFVNRQLVDFPGANPLSIIQMIRLGLPITEENLEQFALYKNYEHQIIQSAAQIMEEIPQTFAALLAEGRDAEAVSFYEQIIKAFIGSEAAGTEESAAGNPQGGTPGDIVKEGEIPGETSEIPGRETVSGDKGQNPAAPAGSASVGADGIMTESTQGGENIEKPLLAKEIWQELGRMLRNLGVDEETAKQISNGNLSPKAVLTQIGELLGGQPHVIQEGFQESVKEFLGSRAFSNLLQSEMTGQWLIRPEDVAEKENVERLYERIREQTAKISEAFQMVGKADAAGAKSVQNLQNNVDFMNQMNHLFTYVQLPLKMAGNQAHGDLYVYTNKKSLANKDGNVSALLHLDMEHLGPMDVYVAMQKSQNKVSTNFTLRDEAALDLVAKHIHILNERLEKRGYSMNANFQLKEKNVPQTNVMREILTQNKNISVLSKTSFDMRA